MRDLLRNSVMRGQSMLPLQSSLRLHKARLIRKVRKQLKKEPVDLDATMLDILDLRRFHLDLIFE